MPANHHPPVRWMKKNHGTETPTSLLFLDTECVEEVVRTTPRKSILRFRLACLTYVRYDGGEVSRRDTLDTDDWLAVWDWIEGHQDARRPLMIYGHNLGFDLTQLRFWELLQLNRFRCGLTTPEESNGVLSGERSYRGRMCVEGFPFFIYAMGQRGICKFVDTMNYFPGSLASLGEKLGRPKQAFPGFATSDEELYRYCRNDVDIIEDAMLRTLSLWRESDAGVWQPTAAMLALTSFRHRLGAERSNGTKSGILLGAKREWESLEREGYYGGQVTCFYVGPIVNDPDYTANPRVVEGAEYQVRPTGPLYLLDVRSLYPAVMHRGVFPFRRLFRRSEYDPHRLRRDMRSYGAVARVLIDDDASEYTLRTAQGQCQAVGRYETVLCGPELQRALESGSVERVIQCQVYCLDRLFREWVDQWIGERVDAEKRGDLWRAEYVKLILNSLSGKFAQQSDRWVDDPKLRSAEPYDRWMVYDVQRQQMRRYRSIAGHVQELVRATPPRHSFPIISAYISAMGREHMRSLRATCPMGSVLYQATDSLLVTQAGYDALKSADAIREGELGALQLKVAAEYGEVLGCNHYRVGEQWVRSGSWGKAVRQPNGRYSYQSFEGLATILSSQPDGTVMVTEHYLDQIGTYGKGSIDVNGWTSWPILGRDAVR